MVLKIHVIHRSEAINIWTVVLTFNAIWYKICDIIVLECIAEIFMLWLFPKLHRVLLLLLFLITWQVKKQSHKHILKYCNQILQPCGGFIRS